MCHMADAKSRIGARQLRHELSKILDRVRAGETIEITDRGVPAARLVPLPERESLIGRLIADGAITPASRTTYPLPAPIRPKRPRMTSEEALEILRDEPSRLP